MNKEEYILAPVYDLEEVPIDVYIKLINDQYDVIRERVKNSIDIIEQECSIHGKCDHSNCSITDKSICLRCLTERRFFDDSRKEE